MTDRPRKPHRSDWHRFFRGSELSYSDLRAGPVAVSGSPDRRRNRGTRLNQKVKAANNSELPAGFTSSRAKYVVVTVQRRQLLRFRHIIQRPRGTPGQPPFLRGDRWPPFPGEPPRTHEMPNRISR